MIQFRGRAVRASISRASVLAMSCVLLSTTAFAATPRPGWGKTHHAGAWEAPYRASGRDAIVSSTWTPLATRFPGVAPETSLLMMNGTVIVHDSCTRRWYRLTPDAKGQYTTGSWSTIAAMPKGYAPLYFASQVLPDGDIIVNGGEYNGKIKGAPHAENCNPAWTTLGAWYNAKADRWVPVQPPQGWSTIGDASSVVLQSGTYMLADCCSTNAALATITGRGAVTWTATGSGKYGSNDEEGWTLLPTGDVLTVDVGGGNSTAELYDPSTGAWSMTATAPNPLSDPTSFEIGPAVLLPNNTVFQVGTDPCANMGCPSHSATYDVTSATWTSGPDLPLVGLDYYTTEDAPAVVLPDGNVLVQMSPAYGCGSAFCSPSHFFEYNGSTWVQVSDPRQAPSDAAYEGRFLPLPTGQELWTSDLGDIEIYTPSGSPNEAWLPTITKVTGTIARGADTELQGTQLTGVADGGKYGDDAQMAEKYPIERITNDSTGDVCFATTLKFSATSSKFVLPDACETGASALEVVVNGISSAPAAITVQ
ncbi:MAG TPA: hypothetical protein VGI20_13270 [Rhizomicrobium sp.]|jgi:hypothetical protein